MSTAIRIVPWPIGARFICVHPVADVYQNRFLENWQEITTIRKPIIAAVSGFAVNIRFPNSPSPSHPPFSPDPAIIPPR